MALHRATMNLQPIAAKPQVQQDSEVTGTDEQMTKLREENVIGEFDKDAFIEAIRVLPCLWDMNNPSYKERYCKRNAWQKLSQLFGKDVDYLQRQFKNIKDTLKKCLDKRNRMRISGARFENLPECKYFKQLTFLHDRSGNKPANLNLIASYNTTVVEIDNTPCRKKPRNIEHDSSCVLDECDVSIEKTKEKLEEDVDEVSLYCRSLVPILRELSKQDMRRARMKIDKILYSIKYPGDSN